MARIPLYQVSEENVKKVETFFVQRAKDTGTNVIKETVVDIAELSGVSLATAHKAIQELVKRKIIERVKQNSLKAGFSYVYKADIEGFEITKNKEEHYEWLKERVEQLQMELDQANVKIGKLVGENNVLKNKLNQDKSIQNKKQLYADV